MKKKKWKKILYEDQGYPTNYTDETFLESMKKNGNIKYKILLEVKINTTRTVRNVMKIFLIYINFLSY